MKFCYEYRTSDNVRHTDVIVASDREAAFAALRAKGIRPGHLEEAPGLFNKLFGKGKRWLAISVLGVLCMVLGFVALRTQRSALRTLNSTLAPLALDATMRRQILGDSAIIEKGIKTGWEDVFAEEGERFLASFAIPGVPAGLRNTTEDAIRAALERKVEPTDADTIEARQVKSIVEGMKAELRRFLSRKGTIVEYGQRLVARQEEEIGYYNRAKTEVDQAKARGRSQKEIDALWTSWNDRLRQMGIKLIPMGE